MSEALEAVSVLQSPADRMVSPDLDPEHSPFGHISNPRKRAYLTAFVIACGNLTRACELASISHGTVYTSQWKEDEEFQEAYELARVMAADAAEDEARRRAIEGVLEPVGFYQGQPSAYVRRYSDSLLKFLLQGAMPEKYVERHQHTAVVGGVLLIPGTAADAEDWAQTAKGQQGLLGSGEPSTNGHGPSGNGDGS